MFGGNHMKWSSKTGWLMIEFLQVDLGMSEQNIFFLLVVCNPLGTRDKKAFWKQLQKVKQMIGNVLWLV